MVLTGDDSATKGPLTMPADTLVFPPGRGTASITGGEGAGDAAEYPIAHRTAPQRGIILPNAASAEVQRLWSHSAWYIKPAP